MRAIFALVEPLKPNSHSLPILFLTTSIINETNKSPVVCTSLLNLLSVADNMIDFPKLRFAFY